MWDAAAVQEMRQSGRSFREIGRELGIPTGTVISRLKKNSLPRGAWVEIVKDMLRAGASLNEASAAVGISVDHVRRVVRQHADISVPSWVPLALRREYTRIAREFDEFEAAKWARGEMPPRPKIQVVVRENGADRLVAMSAPFGSEMEIITGALRAGETYGMVSGQAKDKHSTAARARAVFALHRRGFSASHIGRLLNRDHTTILNTLKRYDENGERIR